MWKSSLILHFYSEDQAWSLDIGVQTLSQKNYSARKQHDLKQRNSMHYAEYTVSTHLRPIRPELTRLTSCFDYEIEFNTYRRICGDDQIWQAKSLMIDDDGNRAAQYPQKRWPLQSMTTWVDGNPSHPIVNPHSALLIKVSFQICRCCAGLTFLGMERTVDLIIVGPAALWS